MASGIWSIAGIGLGFLIWNAQREAKTDVAVTPDPPAVVSPSSLPIAPENSPEWFLEFHDSEGHMCAPMRDMKIAQGLTPDQFVAKYAPPTLHLSDTSDFPEFMRPSVRPFSGGGQHINFYTSLRICKIVEMSEHND